MSCRMASPICSDVCWRCAAVVLLPALPNAVMVIDRNGTTCVGGVTRRREDDETVESWGSCVIG